MDTATHWLIADAEIKEEVAAAYPYRQWLDRNMVALEDLPAPATPAAAPQADSSSLLQRQQAFGYTYEDLNTILAPMGRDGVEPIGSMGNDIVHRDRAHRSRTRARARPAGKERTFFRGCRQ